MLLGAAAAFTVLQRVIERDQGEGSLVATAVGRDLKGRVSPLLYVAGIGLSFVDRWLSMAAYTLVALLWLVPDRRIERVARAGARTPPQG
jgi:hypothetical protein